MLKGKLKHPVLQRYFLSLFLSLSFSVSEEFLQKMWPYVVAHLSYLQTWTPRCPLDPLSHLLANLCISPLPFSIPSFRDEQFKEGRGTDLEILRLFSESLGVG